MIKTYTKDTLTREVLDQGVKLRVIDADHSEAFQRACFERGADWYMNDLEVQYTDKPYIFAKWNLTYDEKESTFIEEVNYQEIYFDDGRELPPSDNTQEEVSLRDYFAGRALQGTLASPANEGMTPEHLAEWSYTLADAMLKARKE